MHIINRAYGDNKHCRKLLNRALNVVTDWPEAIVEAMINFEREEGMNAIYSKYQYIPLD